MKKIRLRLESLAVESFAANARTGEMGTVRGREATARCGGEDTFYVSCNYSACPLDCSDGCDSSLCGVSNPSACYTCTCPNDTFCC